MGGGGGEKKQQEVPNRRRHKATLSVSEKLPTVSCRGAVIAKMKERSELKSMEK
jgi:hypothetical protein